MALRARASDQGAASVGWAREAIFRWEHAPRQRAPSDFTAGLRRVRAARPFMQGIASILLDEWLFLADL